MSESFTFLLQKQLPFYFLVDCYMLTFSCDFYVFPTPFTGEKKKTISSYHVHGSYWDLFKLICYHE